MMNNADQYRHDRSAYERPDFPYRCGRERIWFKPCSRGPGVDGSCGGTADCAPWMSDGRWQCTRAGSAGGRCTDGPLPDGRCSQIRPPCRPRPTLRRIRGRTVALMAIFVVTMIVGFRDARVAIDATEGNSVSPGQLSGAHLRFAEDGSCGSCHRAATVGPWEWIAAAFVKEEPTCTNCHSFGHGSDPDALTKLAHNAVFAERPDAFQETPCLMCHTEHQGQFANISAVSDIQCATCHENNFHSFDAGHPPFGKKFPHENRGAIWFDHATHLNRYFEDARYSEKAPADCVGCHNVERRSRLAARSFEDACSNCHTDDIQDREILVFGLPELEESALDRETVAALCGLTPEQLEDLRARIEDGGQWHPDEEEFDTISDEILSPAAAYFLGAIEDDIDAYGEKVQEVILAMAENGSVALGEVILERDPDAPVESLLAGLAPELAAKAACAWAANLEYEPPENQGPFGWYADELSLYYRPKEHADPVIRGWIEFGLEVAKRDNDGDEDADYLADTFRDELLDRSRGPGACTKCHAVEAELATPDQRGAEAATEAMGLPAVLSIGWSYAGQNRRPNTSYSHIPHLNLLEQGQWCATCHKLNEKADYAKSFSSVAPTSFESNFHAISIETCRECHKNDGVRQDCGLCHNYHRQHAFRRRMN